MASFSRRNIFSSSSSSREVEIRKEGLDPSPPRACKQWSYQGVCDQGTTCQYSHMPSYRFSSIPAIPGGEKFCYSVLKQQNRDACRRRNCPFNHQLPRDLAVGNLAHDTRLSCTHWRRGSCSAGADCVFAHPLLLRGGLKNCAEESPSAVYLWENNKKIQYTRRGGVCRHWREGACLLGEQGKPCKFTHPSSLEGIDKERCEDRKKDKKRGRKRGMIRNQRAPPLPPLAPDVQHPVGHRPTPSLWVPGLDKGKSHDFKFHLPTVGDCDDVRDRQLIASFGACRLKCLLAL